MSEVIFEEATLDELLDYLATTEEAAVEEVRERIAELEQQLKRLKSVEFDEDDVIDYAYAIAEILEQGDE